MKIIYDKCREMFPPVPPKKISKFKAAFSAYMNRNRMEEDIKDLRNRVNKCHSQFMVCLPVLVLFPRFSSFCGDVRGHENRKSLDRHEETK